MYGHVGTVQGHMWPYIKPLETRLARLACLAHLAAPGTPGTTGTPSTPSTSRKSPNPVATLLILSDTRLVIC